ncbi:MULTISPECIES: PCYCGC domain-containing protein [Priestia]|uniref:PCYCGC domain-containing protein n=1 Tax=Priestia TaxID=2800373 RepID=UPI00203E9C60|nr:MULTISPECIES: PCYCGC domain-containing protein [Priestia]MCM3770535.1 PCYCGC domain-containing protein [Priestia aryabhattai]MDY0940903.1 PCYCGC domain-containing protein [Priestia megaterium]
MIKSRIITVVLAASMVSGCGNESKENSGSKRTETKQHEEHQQHTLADKREETENSETLPSFLSDKPEDMQLIYAAAANHQTLLENIPCYCGCGEEANHQNNYDCFIFENKGNGAVTWDDHGTKCGVCLEIAAQAVVDYSKGKSIEDIRQEIDDKYEEGYAKPTPTPEI